MHVSTWKIDSRSNRYVDGSPLYGYELIDNCVRNGFSDPLAAQLLDPQGPQLVRVQLGTGGSCDLFPVAHHCLMLMRRRVLQRNFDSGDFSQSELASIEEFSLVLLPLVGQHALPGSATGTNRCATGRGVRELHDDYRGRARAGTRWPR